MAAYVIANIEVTDPQGYEEYRKLSGPSLAAYGGRFLSRGGAATRLEGTWTPARMVVLEFPDAEQARRWWDSEEYARARAIRRRTARADLILVEGT